MRVLVCGANGFIGSRIEQSLIRDGHQVVRGVSRRKALGANDVAIDYSADIQPEAWSQRLEGVDAVVNAIGVLRDSRSRPIQRVHEAAPKALWQACAQSGVQRVVQISALGVADSQTVYAQTKRAADDSLLALADQQKLSAVVVRPSVVFGRGGASSALFMALAQVPLLVLPAPMTTARVQPVAVQDVADGVAKLLGEHMGASGIVSAVGAHEVGMSDWIASLRQQLGKSRAWMWPLPMPLTRLSARLGDAVPGVPWCSETLAMLGSDNVAPVGPWQQILGREPVAAEALVENAWRRP
ncbi:MAG: hypothetical protein RL357_64 [Pseudomonadota bacterium]